MQNTVDEIDRVLRGRAYFYCQLKNDNDIITSGTLNSSTRPDSHTYNSAQKRRRGAVFSAGNAIAPSSFYLDVPFAGWIFEILPSNSDDDNGIPIWLKQNNCGNMSGINDKHSNNEHRSSKRYYTLLSVPQSFEFIVWQASRNQWIISIPYYIVVPIQLHRQPPHNIQPPQQSTNDNNAPLINISSMIIIPASSLFTTPAIRIDKISPNHSKNHDNENKHLHDASFLSDNNDPDVWTLEQLARYETLETTTFVVTNTEFQLQPRETIKPKKRHYSLMGRVITISPILSVHGKDPFVLMEMVHVDRPHKSDDQNTTNHCEAMSATSMIEIDQDQEEEEIVLQFHCVVVFRKQGLSCHSAIVPNETIVMLHHVRKQQWRIPDLFASHSAPARNCMNDLQSTTTTTTPPPPSIFVVDSPNQITLSHTMTNLDTHDDTEQPSPMASDTNSLIPPQQQSTLSISSISTTTGSTITGRVDKVYFQPAVPRSDQRQHVHLIEIIATTPNQEHSRLRLYTSQYPMSTSLSLLLRLFAQVCQQKQEESTPLLEIIVKIHNVQCLGYNGYAANLYTTFTITDIVPSLLDRSQTNHYYVFESLTLLHFPFPYDIEGAQSHSYERTWIHDLIHSTIYTKGSFGPKWTLDTSNVASDALWKVIQPKKTIAKRNVYIDFFTRPNYCNSKLGRAQVPPATSIPMIHLPYPISISDIQRGSFRAIVEQLKQIDLGSVKVGWTGVKQFIGPLMYEVFEPTNGNLDSEQQYMFTFGRCCTANVEDNDRKAISVSDGFVTLPIAFVDNTTSASSPLGDRTVFTDNALVWVAFRGITVSSICLGVKPMECGIQENEWMSLPIYGNVVEEKLHPAMLHGACGICAVSGHLFMVSVYIVADRLHYIGHPSTERNCFGDSSTMSLEQCLNPTLWSEKSMATSVVALLTRGVYKLGKVKSNVYSDYTIAIAHIPTKKIDQNFEVLSTLQCLDFKPTILLDPSKWCSLQNHFNALQATTMTISEERLTLGVTWWRMACCPLTCALQSGGWDDSVLKLGNFKTFGVVIRIPSSCIYRDSKRGYTRIRGCLDHFDAHLRMFDQCNYGEVIKSTTTGQWFDFVGSSDTLLPGNLDRRSRRRASGLLAHGECLMYRHTPESGIPRNRLSDLFTLLCYDLKSTEGRTYLAPSLTRAICGANFLGINYCRASAKCSKCYEALYNPETLNTDRIYSQWNHAEPDRLMPEHRATLLCCPNGCRIDLNGIIKWECSGLIDDGTGQAKLYAEGDAAVCLLGLSKAALKNIESAIWESNRTDGFIYLRTIPPPSYLREAILIARAMALRNIQQMSGKDARHMNDADVAQFMSPGHYGEYLFHSHCRTSFEPMRSLTYFVRCKPLSDSTNTLNQTEIDLVTTATSSTTTESRHHNSLDNEAMIFVTTTTTPTQSYSLPPINLNLIDCSTPFPT